MSFFSWLRNQTSLRSSRGGAKRRSTMPRFHPNLEALEGRLVPATVVPTPGQSLVILDISATPTTTQLALIVPSGNTVQAPPSPIVPPSPAQQAVLAFLQDNGVPPVPINPGLLIAAGFITPASDFITPS